MSDTEETVRQPDMKLEVWLTEIGIEAHVSYDGQLKHEMVRDFRGERTVDARLNQLLSWLYTMLNVYISGENDV